jgi:hypothetical protein
MNKDQIMSFATPTPSRRDMLDVLASQYATAEAIEDKAAEMQRALDRAVVWGKRCTMALVLPLVLLVLSFIGLWLVSTLVGLGALLAAMVTTCVLTDTGRKFSWKERYYKSVMESLQPIAGTDACQEALEYLEGGAPGVADWRDIALAERGQLYGFDVSIMGRLHRLEQHRIEWEQLAQANENTVDEAERQRLNDEACRKVHGLAPLNLAGQG